ncbi:GNAT family N-acetyltransferase [Rudaea sp. 3F27F6]|uniref:GNAT family N-acetyltransferase n=1 Tax=Rudaea sp. 3F27F6 TaxID=2502208 RepID=UPI0010F7C70A|nr:GNAT family N-acetyltransferase [Rudaea sp. 3F27F6]
MAHAAPFFVGSRLKEYRHQTTSARSCLNFFVMKNSKFAIRVASDGDVSILARLAAQLGYPVDAAEMGARYARVRAARVGEVFVAEHIADEQVVGWTHVVPRLQLEDAPFAELAGLVVDDAVRGAGVGAVLLKAAEMWARSEGFATMRVRSNVVRERAHRFYEREGYERIKAQAVFRKDLK